MGEFIKQGIGSLVVNNYVSLAALEVIIELAQPTDVICGVKAILKYDMMGPYHHPFVREAAVHKIVSSTGKGDAIAMLLQCLDDMHDSVRIAAVQALQKVAQKGDATVIATLGRQLGSDFPPLIEECRRNTMNIKRLMAKALAKLAEEGDVVATNSFVAGFHCLPQEPCKFMGMECLAQAYTQGLVTVTSASDAASIGLSIGMGLLKNDDENVRAAGVEILAGTQCKGDTAVIAALNQLFADSSEDGADGAKAVCIIKALAILAERGDEGVTSKLLKALQDPCEEVRFFAAEGLSHVAKCGNSDVISALCLRLKDSDVEVGQQAAETLGSLAAGTNDSAATDALKEALTHDNENIVKAAGDALKQVASPAS